MTKQNHPRKGSIVINPQAQTKKGKNDLPSPEGKVYLVISKSTPKIKGGKNVVIKPLETLDKVAELQAQAQNEYITNNIHIKCGSDCCDNVKCDWKRLFCCAATGDKAIDGVVQVATTVAKEQSIFV